MTVNLSSPMTKAALACAAIALLAVGTHTPAANAGEGDAIIGGVGYLDRNVNGKRDAGEPTQFGWYKVTSGGSYFTCGFTGKGDTFGVPAKPGTYYVMPIAVKGFHTTTPIIKVEAKTAGQSFKVEMGFAQDTFAGGDKCSQYEPKRVIRQNGLGIIETAISAGGFSTLLTAVEAAGLTGALQGSGPFTVFAPNDLAFAKFTDEEIAALIKDKAALAKVLTFHVVPGRISANDIVNGATLTTLQGGTLKVEATDDGVTINGATIVASDIQTANGIIHVIDTVMVP